MNAMTRALQDFLYRFFGGAIRVLGGLQHADRSYALATVLGNLRCHLRYYGPDGRATSICTRFAQFFRKPRRQKPKRF